MTEKQVEALRIKLYTKVGGPLYGIFFTGKHFTPKNVLLSNEDILEKLEIPYESANSLEQEGIMRLLYKAIASLRKGTELRQQPWIDITLEDDLRQVAYHGFADDLNKAISCLYRVRKMARNSNIRAKIRERILKRAFPQIEEKKSA